jgi:hypothetical protein
VTTIAFLIPILFWRITVDPFDLMKGSFLWFLGLPLVFVLLAKTLQGGHVKAPKLFAIPASLFFAALLVSVVSSIAPEVSVFGQSQRYTGLLTLAACLLVAASLAGSPESKYFQSVKQAHLLAGTVVVLYGLIQEFEVDPFAWSATSFLKLVFSTLGNPNTATAWLGCTLPLLFSRYLDSVKRHILDRAITACFLGAGAYLIVAFQSFQGQLAVLLCLPVALIWLSTREFSLTQGVAVAISLGAVLVVPQMTGGVELLVVSVGISLGSAILLGTSWFSGANRTVSLARIPKRTRVLSAIGGVVIVAGMIVGFRRQFSSGFAGGFLERGDFFRAARDVWFDKVWLGSGLETFGFVFTEYRPASHAINLDDSRTSSVHNIFLGMFSNGGIVLGLAYLVLTICTASAAWRVLRSYLRSDITVVGVVSSWVAFQLVSLVSVEHVALFLLNFVFMGLIFNRLPRDTSPSAMVAKKGIRRRGAKSKPRLKTSAAVALLVAVPAVVVGWYQVSRPMRAGIEGFEAMQDFYSQGGTRLVVDRLEKATELAPWDATNWLRLAEVQAQAGDYAVAVPAVRKAVETSFFIGPAAKSASIILFNGGQVDEAIEVMREALTKDPHSPGVKASLAEILLYGAQSAYGEGNLDVAKARIEESQQILPGYTIEGLDELLQAVGLPS